MEIIYKVKFRIINLNKSKERDLKIDLLTTNYIMEFESKYPPYIKEVGNMIIFNKEYKISSIKMSFQEENGYIVNNIYVDVSDLEIEKAFKKSELAKKIKEYYKEDINNRGLNIDDFIF